MLRSGFVLSETVEIFHMILDSWIECSIKDHERMGRDGAGDGIDIINLSADTQIPIQVDKFIRSTRNKQNLGLLVREKVVGFSRHAIASGMVIDAECLPAVESGGQEQPDLQTWAEEADMRLLVNTNGQVKVRM